MKSTATTASDAQAPGEGRDAAAPGIYLIAAQSENRVIGDGLEIPWYAKGEQQLFKQITRGGTLVMGRKTYETVGRPLPHRHTIVLSRNPARSFAGCDLAESLAAALALAQPLGNDIFVAGGGGVYREALPLCHGLHLTTVHIQAKGDVTFPEFDPADFRLVEEETFQTNLGYTYRHYLRLEPPTHPSPRQAP